MQPTNLNKLSFLALRVMGSLIFITAAFNHLFQTEQAAARLQKASLGFLATSMASPEFLVLLSGFGLLAGGFLLLAGYQTRLAALLLFFILIPITITMQVGSMATMGPLFKNIAIMGILLFFIANGAVYFGLDQYLARRKTALGSSAKGPKMAAAALGFILLTGLSVQNIPALANNPETAVLKKEKMNYAVLISQPDHLKAAVNTAQTMRKDAQYQTGEFVVMACAKSVEAFKKGSELKSFFEAGKAAGVTFMVCGMSLEKFKIAEAEILPGAEIVPNGLTYMFDLKAKGFVTV